MTRVCREIFRAIHEGKWLSIEYRNRTGQTTKYWIGIKTLDARTGWLRVDGLHLGEMKVRELNIKIESILTASLLDGSYQEINRSLVEDIAFNPTKYAALFDRIPNHKILNYLSDCYRLDATPYRSEYSLVHCFDGDSFDGGVCALNDIQFARIVREFQRRAVSGQEALGVRLLGLNEISIPTRQGLYVLAYRPIYLDVKNRLMRAGSSVVFCREFTIHGERMSIRRFLEPEDWALLEEEEPELELIRDYITLNNPGLRGVDDMPYVIAIGMDSNLDLDREYGAILDMYSDGRVTTPLRAFFGEYLKRPVRRKNYPLALMDRRSNLDQLLAINNALRFPMTYVQGPPGSGKTSTILNIILTAFFNERTVLFASSNNHPIDEVCKKLRSLRFRGKPIPFPAIRLGNTEVVRKALDEMLAMYESVRSVPVYSSTLDRRRDEKARRAAQLTELLGKYCERLDLMERREVIQRLLKETSQLNFQFELQSRQLEEVDRRLAEIGPIRDEDALALIDDDEEAFLLLLYYTSVRCIKRIGEPKNSELLGILRMDPENPERINSFNRYISKTDNLHQLQRIFPIIATTCISAHRLGEPGVHFSMTILDEASQCGTAVSLVPILRGENLVLVGDPQQLCPVTLLDAADNQTLRKKYAVAQEYDYLENSVYKVFLSCDPVSDEVLLRHHYRCHPKIIGFNNRKYYNSQLIIDSRVDSPTPLTFVDVSDAESAVKNTSPGEAESVLQYVLRHPEKSIGVITPFTNQRQLIADGLRKIGRPDVACGTVHAFQGDEKDVILFSLGLSDTTAARTYDWLKNNRELINVATSRARKELIVLGSRKNLRRLHGGSGQDDLFELVEYILSNGTSAVTERAAPSRALGIKPYSTETEAAFMESLNHAIDVLQPSGARCIVRKEVPVSQVFTENPSRADLFYTGRFDFVVYEIDAARREWPVLAIELDGKEHYEDDVVRARDRKKQQICREHHFELIRVENTYARRYHYIKDILINYFTEGRGR